MHDTNIHLNSIGGHRIIGIKRMVQGVVGIVIQGMEGGGCGLYYSSI